MPVDLLHGLQAIGVVVGAALAILAVGYAVVDRGDGLDGDERFADAWGAGLAWLALGRFFGLLIGA